MPKQRLVPTADVAKALGVHVRTVHRMVADGRLKPEIKVPGMRGAYLFREVDVERVRSELGAVEVSA